MDNHIFPRGNGGISPDHEDLASSEWMETHRLFPFLEYQETSLDNINPFLIGKRRDTHGQDQLLKYEDDSHITTLAGSRSGKGVSLVIPNLLSYQGSIICVDLKGENASMTAEYRRDVLGQAVIVLDPFNETTFKTNGLNPLSMLDKKSKVLVDDISDIAEALIVRDDAKNAHWDESAKSVIKMILLYIVFEHPEEERTLVWLRDYLLTGIESDLSGTSSFSNFLVHIEDHKHPFIAGMARRLLDMGDNERGSILSTVHRNTEFLDSLSIHDVIGFSDLDLSQLRSKKGASIYLVMPERRLAQQSRWLRLMITLFLQYLQTDKKTDVQQPSVLFVLDECASLGYMQVIERAMGYIAGFGVKIWVIYQDLSQIKDIYPKRWETFLGNTGILTAFGNIDLTTQEYLSKRLGQCETHRIEHNYSGGESENKNKTGVFHLIKNPLLLLGAGGASGKNEGWTRTPKQVLSPLLLPDEIGREFGKKSGLILILIGGAKPIWAHRIYYYEDAPFKDRAGVNPYYN